MQVDFKSGDLVANKANLKKAFTFLRMQNDNENAIVVDDAGEKYTIPVVALTKYEPPKGPTIRDMSNMW